ncbi:aminopeptidase P family protein [Candidatus Phytoplasma bonamiae]|uniref:Xaa-Pro aminopeptidase n=1 Tax=Candidatus Phytoplasma bonamiae TaxID=2982626 RepID=A0ABT9D4E4_9MOLU|nr:aminopeptidase P family protein ['Bonamia sp.' little leaf phytoplasma]MDO8064307.1 Xaa-Pro aminopeptidase ['Bonamia sp.' little leaf phytoplasma]
MFFNNRKNFFDCITNNSIAVFYSGNPQYKSGDQSFPFEVDKNFYYLTGIKQPYIILIVVKKSSTKQSFLFVPNIDPMNKLWKNDQLEKKQISDISQISCTNIFETKEFHFQINKQISELKLLSPKIYFDIPNNCKELKYCWSYEQVYKFLNYWPCIEISNSSRILFKLRQQKNQNEINYIKHSIDIHYQSFMYLFKQLKNCQYEFEIAAHLHYFWAMNKAQNAFETIVASGKNALILHYHKNNSYLYNHDLCLIDSGVKINDYSSDITRCFPIKSTFTPIQYQIYNLVLKTNKELINWVKPEHSMKDLNTYGKQILSKGMQKLGFEEKIENYFYHSISHHLGLDIHDVIDIDVEKPVGEDSIISIEPGLYIDYLNLGIRIEDNIIVKKKGNINLSSNIPKEIKEIEYLIK